MEESDLRSAWNYLLKNVLTNWIFSAHLFSIFLRFKKYDLNNLVYLWKWILILQWKIKALNFEREKWNIHVLFFFLINFFF